MTRSIWYRWIQICFLPSGELGKILRHWYQADLGENLAGNQCGYTNWSRTIHSGFWGQLWCPRYVYADRKYRYFHCKVAKVLTLRPAFQVTKIPIRNFCKCQQLLTSMPWCFSGRNNSSHTPRHTWFHPLWKIIKNQFNNLQNFDSSDLVSLTVSSKFDKSRHIPMFFAARLQ